MEYIVDRHHKNTTKVIGKACKICRLPILEGDYVITKHRARIYHKACFEAMFIEARKTSSERWRKSHPEECRRRQREWRQRNPEKVRAARKKHYQEHREEERAARKRRYQLHPFKDWTPEEKKKHYAQIMSSRRKRRMELAKA
ncbi:MAG: hypothetical protein ABSF44_10470 [Candidatus Bathyarchaeia archaeon]